MNKYTLRISKILETKNSTIFNKKRIEYVAVIMNKLKDYGYTLTEKAANLLSVFTNDELNLFSLTLTQHFQEIGVISNSEYTSYRSMFGDFPRDVYSMPDGISEFLQFFQYFHGIDYVIDPDVNTLKNKSETAAQLKTIDVISINDYKSKLLTLLYSETKISETDKEELLMAVDSSFLEKIDINFNKISQKEIFVIISATYQNTIFNDIVDVLRVAKYIGKVEGGEQLYPIDKKNKNNFNYNLTSENKLYLINCIDNLSNKNFDFSNSIRKQLIYLFNVLGKPIGYKNYNKIVWKIRNTRNKQKENYPSFQKPETSRFLLEKFISKGYYENAMSSLSGGNFLRAFNRLYGLVLKSGNKELYDRLLEELAKKLSSVSLNVRIQFFAYLKTRTTISIRYVKLKHKKAKQQIKKNYSFIYNDEFANLIGNIIFNSIELDIAKKPSFNGKKIFIDERFKKCSLELDISRLSSNMKSYPKFFDIEANFDNVNYIVPFVFVKSKLKSGQTIDLSCVLFDDGFNAQQISYLRHVDSTKLVRHSGDSWMRTGDVSEYINIDLNSKYRYAVIGVLNFIKKIDVGKDGYVAHGLSLLNDSFDNRAYSPENAVHTFNGDQISGSFYSYIIDLKEKRISLIGEEFISNSAQRIDENIAKKYLIEYLDTTKKSWYDIMISHVKYRNGALVNSPESADILFDSEFASDSRNLIQLF